MVFMRSRSRQHGTKNGENKIKQNMFENLWKRKILKKQTQTIFSFLKQVTSFFQTQRI